MDKGDKTHIRHDSQNVSAIFCVTFFFSNLRRIFIYCLFIKRHFFFKCDLLRLKFLQVHVGYTNFSDNQFTTVFLDAFHVGVV